ncbi:MAG: NAD(P)/FAD-dependent oxidoreductase [Nitrospinia bacterium]
MTKIAIIGAGLSGLSAARFLKDRAEITLFEKARSVSGRISTRRAEPYFFDHGAQYFTARTKAFNDFIQPLINQGFIERWNARYVKFDSGKIIERKNWINDEPRYVGVPGMNKIAKHLAKELNVHINTRIISLKRGDLWQLTDESGQVYSDFDWVISTTPSPQAAELLPKRFIYYEDIKDVKMHACFSLMLGFSESLPLEFEAAHVIHSDLSWIAVNSHKPGRADPFTLMVHSSEKYSEAHIDDDRETVMQHLMNETSNVIGHDVSIANYKTVHGWRYANNVKRKNCHIFLDPDLKLAACGDWCLGGRVEGAFTSAYNLVNAMKDSVL